MIIYTHTTADHGDLPAGSRIEASVVRTTWGAGDGGASGGYRVGEFRPAGAGPRDGGWRLMSRTYLTLAGLLVAVRRGGYLLDLASVGVR
jgi:hypothetical protein